MREMLFGAWVAGTFFLYGFTYGAVFEDCKTRDAEIQVSCKEISIVVGVAVAATWPVWLPFYVSVRGWGGRE